MIAVIQRVQEASCSVDGKMISRIGKGLLILVGIGKDDTLDDADRLAERCVNLRCFSDDKRKMNLSLLDISGECMVISQVTLLALTDRGRRPDFSRASSPEYARKLYHRFINALKNHKTSIKEGLFGAYMQVELVNDGPVTLILES
ncbi:D-tyrosyl-tRNA(Tyr) deacylase [candidate division WOR-3 bacterium]|nr:D-tyrosyl-tRNA(Tyr) deacylase [candidate division WOR-3 bacterium]